MLRCDWSGGDFTLFPRVQVAWLPLGKFTQQEANTGPVREGGCPGQAGTDTVLGWSSAKTWLERDAALESLGLLWHLLQASLSGLGTCYILAFLATATGHDLYSLCSVCLITLTSYFGPGHEHSWPLAHLCMWPSALLLSPVIAFYSSKFRAQQCFLIFHVYLKTKFHMYSLAISNILSVFCLSHGGLSVAFSTCLCNSIHLLVLYLEVMLLNTYKFPVIVTSWKTVHFIGLKWWSLVIFQA